MVLNYIQQVLIGSFMETFSYIAILPPHPQATDEQLAARGLKTTGAPAEDADTASPPEA